MHDPTCRNSSLILGEFFFFLWMRVGYCLILQVVLCSFLINVTPAISDDKSDDWMKVEMPTKSYFAGFSPPKDLAKWHQAKLDAADGKQVLLRKVVEQINYPDEIISGDIRFGWIHRMADMLATENKEKNRPLEKEFEKVDTGLRAPILLLGYNDFPSDQDNFEGPPRQGYFGNLIMPNKVIMKYQNENFKLPKKTVAIGFMNENWGWLSTNILNRTCMWGFNLVDDVRSGDSRDPAEQLKPFLDDPNLVMLLVNQHHNVTHPKVITLPRGVVRKTARVLWDEAHVQLNNGTRKDSFLFSASSVYRHRPAILRCVRKNMGDSISTHVTKKWGQNLNTKTFLQRLLGARAVLALPGLGYDCWRIWEALLAGSMPILERGAGLERSLYKLPALLLDDFAYLTPELLRQAYVEALYRADEWDYTRITERHWQRLIFEASLKGNIDQLMRLHPMEAVDLSFTRPMIPFDCDAMGGCGPDTKRVPKKYCAVDPKTDFTTYDWKWFENRRRREDAKKKQKENKRI